MQRIVDASLVAKWFQPEEHKDKAEQILRHFIDDKVQLAAPLVAGLFVLVASLNRAGALQAVAKIALKIAISADHKIYDMLLLPLRRNPLAKVMADKTLVNKLGKTFACLRWIGDI